MFDVTSIQVKPNFRKTFGYSTSQLKKQYTSGEFSDGYVFVTKIF